MFLYPEYDGNGKKVLSEINGVGSEMLMDIFVQRLNEGGKAQYSSSTQEIALLLLSGKVKLSAEGVEEIAERKDLFEDMPTTLHCPKNQRICVEALESCEYLVISTENDRDFPVKLYRKQEVIRTVSCEGRWENTAVRDVNTVFDYDNAPWSNLVIGEVLARQGRWWSYTPHSHPQPEVYYYRFNRPEGFGACFIGDEAHTIKDGSVGGFTAGKTHVQVTAPCFPMYCCWIIRHLDGDPWLKTRIVDPRYLWVDETK